MPVILLSFLGKLLLSIASSALAERLALAALAKLAASTESDVDDQLVAVVKDVIEGKDKP